LKLTQTYSLHTVSSNTVRSAFRQELTPKASCSYTICLCRQTV